MKKLFLTIGAWAAAISLFASNMQIQRRWYDVTAGSVTINIANGGLGGTIQTSDGIMGFMTHGVSESGGYTLGTPVRLTGMTSVATEGITEANNPYAYRHLTEFYNEAGDGAVCWFMMVSTATTIASMASNSNANGVKKLLDASGGEIKVIGLLSDDKAIVAASGTVTVTNSINADCYTAASNLKVVLAAYALAQQPMRGLIGGTSYNGTASGLTNQTSGSNNRVALIIGDTEIYDATNGSAAVGLALGTLARIPVQRKMSRVASGPLTTITAYLASTALLCTNADITTISGKGYITFTAYARKSGFFWQGDPTMTATTDDYRILANGRVMDKAQVITYLTYLERVDDELPIVPDSGGKLEPTFVGYLQRLIVDQITNTMKVNKEISAVDCYINPEQDVVTNSRVDIVIEITPYNYANSIRVSLGLVR